MLCGFQVKKMKQQSHTSKEKPAVVLEVQIIINGSQILVLVNVFSNHHKGQNKSPKGRNHIEENCRFKPIY